MDTFILGIPDLALWLSLALAVVAVYWNRRGVIAQESAGLSAAGNQLTLAFAATRTIAHTAADGDDLPLLLKYPGGSKLSNVSVKLTAQPGLLRTSDECTQLPEPFDPTLRDWHTVQMRHGVAVEAGEEVKIWGLEVANMAGKSALLYCHILVGREVVISGHKLHLGVRPTLDHSAVRPNEVTLQKDLLILWITTLDKICSLSSQTAPELVFSTTARRSVDQTVQARLQVQSPIY